MKTCAARCDEEIESSEQLWQAGTAPFNLALVWKGHLNPGSAQVRTELISRSCWFSLLHARLHSKTVGSQSMSKCVHVMTMPSLWLPDPRPMSDSHPWTVYSRIHCIMHVCICELFLSFHFFQPPVPKTAKTSETLKYLKRNLPRSEREKWHEILMILWRKNPWGSIQDCTSSLDFQAISSSGKKATPK